MSPDSGFASPNVDAVDSCGNLEYLNLLSPPGPSKLLFPIESGYFVSKSRRRLHFSDSEVRRPLSYKVTVGTQTEEGFFPEGHATTRREERSPASRLIAQSLKEMADDFEQYLLEVIEQEEATQRSNQSRWSLSALCGLLFGQCFKKL